MIGLRPKPSTRYIERPRLLRLLPEEPGYAVWLEAPYGYGKSVLIAQWVSRLEAEGWRVFWLGLVEHDARRALVGLLGLPENTPWTVILEKLADEPSVVVLEDLEPVQGEGLGPLLKHNPGLVLLASRKNLREPELLRVQSEGRLIHLKTPQLAFTPEEANELFDNTQVAKTAWEQTRGWSLPLHLAALTGEVPREGLWEGLAQSLESSEWHELLFLAALDYLPQQAAIKEDLRLAELGFVQALEQGYRLHPMAAEPILATYAPEVKKAVVQNLDRLEPRLRGLASERVGLWASLEQLLVANTGIGEQYPLEVERWSRVLPPSPDPRTALALQRERAYALGKLGQGKEATELFLQVAASPDSQPREALLAYGEALYELAKFDLEHAKAILAKGDALLEGAAPEDAANYLNASAGVDYWANDPQAAAVRYKRALALAPPGLLRTSCRYNLSLMQWWLDGDGAALLAARQQILADPASGLSPAKRAFYTRNAGIKAAMTGFNQEAKQLLRQTVQLTEVDPLSALQAEAMLCLLEGHLEAMPALWAKLESWNNPNANDRVLHKWLLVLLEAGKPEEALARYRDGNLSGPLEALVFWFAGQHTQAIQALPEPLDPIAERERCLLIRATRFRILRDEQELEEFLKLSVERERPLSYYIPLHELPQHRPELTRYYPLEAVLKSNWKEAIALHLDRIPFLELQVLGKVEVRCLGQVVALNPRPKEVLLLLALGLARTQIAEAVWPEAEAEKSRNNLHVTLNQLRKALEPWGIPTYLFETGLKRVHCDLCELQTRIEAGDLSALMQGYKRLAPEIEISEVKEYREHLELQVFKAVLGSSNTQNTEERLEWVLSHDPLHEAAFAALLKLWLASGRRVTAERRYKEFAQKLHSELGLKPPRELQQLLA